MIIARFLAAITFALSAATAHAAPEHDESAYDAGQYAEALALARAVALLTQVAASSIEVSLIQAPLSTQ